MFESREIFPVSMEHALLANRVVSLLNRVEKGKDAPNKEVVLNDALQFLKFIEEGRKSTEAREVTAQSYEAALAYGEAIKAFALEDPLGSEDQGDFDGLLRDLIEITTELRNDKSVVTGSVKSLATFFGAVRDITLGSGQRRIEVLKFSE